MGKTLYEKVWDAHAVGRLADGRTQLFIGTHLIHEVTSPQAFGMIRDLGLKVKYPHRTFATVDHIVPRCRGGQTDFENCVACCPACNARKGGRTPTEARLHLQRRPCQPTISEFIRLKFAALGLESVLDEILL